VLLLARRGATAGVPAALGRAVVRGARLAGKGKPLPGAVSPRAVRLADGLLPSLSTNALKSAATLLLALVVMAAGAGLAATQGADAPPREAEPAEQPRRPADAGAERTDRFGDPLPAGALARLGTTRFRQGFAMYCAAFSPDGKTVAAGGA